MKVGGLNNKSTSITRILDIGTVFHNPDLHIQTYSIYPYLYPKQYLYLYPYPAIYWIFISIFASDPNPEQEIFMDIHIRLYLLQEC